MTADHENKFLSSTKRDPAFISKGFTYWKEATGAFKKHQESRCHREATEALVVLPKHVSDVGEVLDKQHKEEKATNRRILLKILQNIKFLSRQGLPLRHNSLGEIDSNFTQLLLLQSLDMPEIVPWLKKKTDKYVSHDIQNEYLQIMALRIVREISSNIRNAGCYTLMADECTDISNKEQFTICIRWVDEDLEDHEDFIGLYEVPTIDANTLVQAIRDTLLRMGLSVSQCRGQCYDGASNMSGKKTGVATRILSQEKRAIYTHCYGHALNLAVSNTIKQSQICNEALEVAFEICRLIKYSPKRNNAFDQIKAKNGDEDVPSVGIRKFCSTRWTVRGESISSILENYNVLKQLWGECLEKRNDADIKGRIIGVNTQMTKYKLLFGLCLCERILKITDHLSKTIQHENMSASEAQVIAKQTIRTLEKMRADEQFTLFFEYVNKVRENTHTDEPTLPRKRKMPSRFEEGQDDVYHSPTVEERYRRIYFEVLDLAVSSIKERFDQPGYVLYLKRGKKFCLF